MPTLIRSRVRTGSALVVLVAVLTVVLLVTVGTQHDSSAGAASTASNAGPPATSGVGTDEAPDEASDESTGDEVSDESTADEAAAVATLAVTTSVRWSVAVRDLDTGAQYAWGDAGVFDTASIVKVDILLALLLQAQDEGRDLTAPELEVAEAMISVSDNDATTSLFRRVGGEAGLEAANARLGIVGIDVGSQEQWGLSQTTAAAQLDVLAAVLPTEEQVAGLDAAYRAVAESLLAGVVPEQRFGVTAAADDPDAALVKVGQLQRSTTGLWDVTSLGRVERDGRRYLVVVLTDGAVTYPEGVAATETVAIAAISAAAMDAA